MNFHKCIFRTVFAHICGIQAYFTYFTCIFAHFFLYISCTLPAYLLSFLHIFHVLFSAYFSIYKCMNSRSGLETETRPGDTETWTHETEIETETRTHETETETETWTHETETETETV